ncbi:hypothetical protein HOY80DRAFT_992138 [Tuber brumale]|nr:hypothetical protein HOY80DRAFT_992138 [Tuber brumale]
MDGQTLAVNFGEELKDSFKPISAWVAGGIAWLDDIQSFYRERAVIEKEYAAKLNALAKKYFEKRAKKCSSLSVGDTPFMTPGSLESSSLTTWTTILSATEYVSREHDNFAACLSNNVCDSLKSIATRYEDYRKRHESFAAKLLAERDSVYSDLKKSKDSYDATCRVLEEKRAKIDKSYDAAKPKAEKSYQTQHIEMNNVKNTYILQIAVTNRQKQKYFYEDLPELINSLQDLNETRVAKLNSLWTLSNELDSTCRKNTISHLSGVIAEIARNIPTYDSTMFAKHNMTGWAEPSNFVFEPSPIWHDTDEIVVDENAKVFLRNLLGKSRRGLEDAKTQVESRRKEINALRESIDTIKLDESKMQKEIDATRGIFYNFEELAPHSTKLTTLQIEIETILGAVGEIERGTQTHKFKPTTFKIPTNCDFCNETLWGLKSKGFTCQDCGYSCHKHCEMKVPAACLGVLDKAAKKALKEEKRMSMAIGGSNGNDTELSRSNTMNSLSSSYSGGRLRTKPSASKLPTSMSPSAASAELEATPNIPPPRRNRVIAPPPERYVSPPSEPTAELPEHGKQKIGRMIYTYSGTGEGEISIGVGAEVVVVEPDDGSGWVMVRSGHAEGLVPATYIDVGPSPAARPSSVHSSSNASIANSTFSTGKKKGPAVKPKRGAKRVRHVEALYDYEARSGAEHSMIEGDRFVLVKEDDGSGWAEVEKGGIVKSVPAAYVQVVEG